MIAIICVIFIAIIFYLFDPLKAAIFPSCPFLSLTGWQCPGCGAQRALHHIANGEVAVAYGYNPLLVISIPYIVLYYVLRLMQKSKIWARKTLNLLYHGRAVYVILFIVISFFILRNLI